MAKPMTAAQFLAQLKKWEITARPYKADWATHNRGNRGNGWADVHGLIQHHTGSDADQPGYLWTGEPNPPRSLPGPLCHVANDASGRLWLIGWGRANHAGLGDSGVLSKVISENYSGMLKPTKMDTDGNGYFYGVENEYSGNHGMTHAQYLTACKLGAAICDFHKWHAKSVIGHGEWSTQKWDPGYAPGKIMDMNAMRNDIAMLLAHGPRALSDPPKTSTPPPVSAAKVYDLKVGDTVRIGNSTLKVTEVK